MAATSELVTVTCPGCNKSFEFDKKKQPRRQYCSQQCWRRLLSDTWKINYGKARPMPERKTAPTSPGGACQDATTKDTGATPPLGA